MQSYREQFVVVVTGTHKTNKESNVINEDDDERDRGDYWNKENVGQLGVVGVKRTK